MAIHRLARPLRRTALSSTFFSSHQPTLALRASTSSQRPISFSSSSGAPSDSSSGSHGARGSRSKTGGSSSSPAGRSSSPSPSPSRKLPGPAQSAPPAVHLRKGPTPWASELPHAGPALVCFDGFFALHRPLLELPVRFRSRKLTTPISHTVQPSLSLDHAPEEEVLQAFETLDLSRGPEDEFVQVVDLAEDGTLGTPYMAKLGGADHALRDVDASEESLIAEDVQFEAELAHDQLEADQLDQDGVRFESPYDAHLIGEPEGFNLAPSVARYLAEHQPFSIPAGPAASSTASAPPTDARTSSALAFLRPFTQTQQSPSHLLTTPPMSSSESQLQADKFLAGAQMHHAMSAHRDAIDFVHEPLALAANFYSAPLEAAPIERGSFEGPRQKGEIRVWSESEGWQVVDFSGVGASDSPFLPAEWVDLDFAEEEGLMGEGEVRMDSTKRKRKRKIRVHKRKKRRKEQRALRQRLGK